MRAPRFWDRRPRGWQALALAPLGWLYDAVTRLRFQAIRPVSPPLPVICIGNFTAGGTGKTPTAIAIAGLLKTRGRKPVFLTRGYGGRKGGPLIVDPAVHRADDVGDEALLLARAAPTAVSRNRPAGAGLAADAGGDIVVMDDGLQNPSLKKDVAIAVVDAATGVGNGCVIPAGPLRAGLAFQISLVHALILVGEGEAAEETVEAARRRGIPVFRAALRPVDTGQLAGKRVVAFAGIGRPEKFFETLAASGARIADRRSFGDHHVYSERDAEYLLQLAEKHGAQLVTTEKDLSRLAGCEGAPGRLRDAATSLAVSVVFENPEGLADFLLGGRR